MTMLGFGTYRGARRTRPPAAAAPPSELSPRDALIAAPATLAVWDTTEAASMTRPEGGHPSAPGDTIGTLSTLGLAPLPASNNIGDLERELAFAQQHSGIAGLELALGTEPFSPLL